jgi:hypothetical protein
MRTQLEIAEKCKADEAENPLFGMFTTEVLIPYLDGEHAKPFLKKGSKTESWEKEIHSRHSTDADVLEEMKAYMGFAWEKTINHRGISSIRSITKMRAWLWLLGDNELFDWAGDEANYTNYGAPILMRISKQYKFEIPDEAAVFNMASGRKCRSDCQEGCSTI